MNKKGQVTLSVLFLIFIVVLVGLALFGEVIDKQAVATTKQSVANESFSLTSCYTVNGTVNESNSACTQTVNNAPTDWKQNFSECHISSVVVTNSNESVTLVEGTDYNLSANVGQIIYLNTTNTSSSVLTDNVTLTDYSYCGDGYNKDSSARGVASLWTIFYALIVAAVALVGIRRWLDQ